MTDKPRVTYSEKLKDPRWQKRRLKILERDEFLCQGCFSSTKTLHVHHRWYEAGKDPWDYADDALVTVCEDCHEEERTSRRDIEDELIEFLRRRLIVGDLECLVGALKGLPPEVLLGLAHTEQHPNQWNHLESHAREQLDKYEAIRRRAEEDIDRERGKTP